MIVKAVHEQSVQQMTFCTVGVFSSTTRWRWCFGIEQPELGHGVAAVGEQALAERGIDPGPGDDARAVPRHPLLLGEVRELLDRLGRLQAAFVEGGLDRIDALLHGSDGGLRGVLVGHVTSPSGRKEYSESPGVGQASMPPVLSAPAR